MGTLHRHCWQAILLEDSKGLQEYLLDFYLFIYLLLVEFVQEAKQLQWLVRAICCAINTRGVLSSGDQTAQCKAETSSYPKTQLQFRNQMLGLVLVLLFLLRHF